MALISLHGCTGWSAPLLFPNSEDRFFRVEAYMESVVLGKKNKQADINLVFNSFLASHTFVVC